MLLFLLEILVGKHQIEIAKGKAKEFLVHYSTENRQKLQVDYSMLGKDILDHNILQEFFGLPWCRKKFSCSIIKKRGLSAVFS